MTDCSTNRFATLQEAKEEKENPFLVKNKSDTKKTGGSRWIKLESLENVKINENTFKNSRNHRRDSDNYNNSDSNSFRGRRDNRNEYERRGQYHRSAFRRETRPKTPPPKTFKLAEDDFPALG